MYTQFSFIKQHACILVCGTLIFLHQNQIIFFSLKIMNKIIHHAFAMLCYAHVTRKKNCVRQLEE